MSFLTESRQLSSDMIAESARPVYRSISILHIEKRYSMITPLKLILPDVRL
jgi:hypothetical protein